MKPRAQIILIAAVLLGIAAWSSMQRGARSAVVGRNGGACCPLMAGLDTKLFAVSTDQTTTNAAAYQVIAYYFHATVRCETCLLIEAQAQAVIAEQFNAELAANRLMFMSVNYELPENAHYLTDYQLPCPSLVLVRQKDGKDEKWRLLGEVWQLVQDPEKLNRYVETELRNLLNDQGKSTTTNKVNSPSALRPGRASVAQVSNLLYRRLPVGSAWQGVARPDFRGVSGLEIRDTADWKSALQL